MSKVKPVTCTAPVSRFMGGMFNGDNACGNPSKGPNAKGEPRCGVHGDAAIARARAKQEEAAKAERDRAAAWAQASYKNALSTVTEAQAEAIYEALKVTVRFSRGADFPGLAEVLAKLDLVKK